MQGFDWMLQGLEKRGTNNQIIKDIFTVDL
jgi:hypothetical protein